MGGIVVLLLLTAVLAGCRAPATMPKAVKFTDVTASANLRFVHDNGAVGGKWLPETMGSGCAFIDYDGDGRPDIFLVNSRDWTPDELRRGKVSVATHPARSQTCALYHNRGDGTFEDVTKKAHLDVPMFGQGVCVGDFNND